VDDEGRRGGRWAGLGLAALLAGVVGCAERNVFVPPPPPDVTVATPIERQLGDTIEFTGSTQATASVDLRARVNGYLESIEFQDGQIVKQGDLLFVIERAPFESALHGAQANLEKALAAQQLAEANLARTTELFRRNVTSQQELDVQRAQSETARAEVAAARAALEQAELNLNYTEIRAPIGGRIGRRLVDEGNLVQAESSSLGMIESLDPIYAYFYVSERDLLRFRELGGNHRGPQLEGEEPREPPVLELGLAAEEDFEYRGLLDYQDLGVDPATGTIMRRGVFANPDNRLLPGLFVRIRQSIGEPQTRLLVESRALGSDQRGDFLLVVDEQNRVEYRPVELGVSVDGMRVIEKGIRAGERVVVNGLQRARVGAEVVPRAAEQGGADEVAEQQGEDAQDPLPTDRTAHAG
jgi:RND family efflux transporter MFP subunit